MKKKNVLKGSRWLLLKNPENLKSKGDEYKRLFQALSLNQPLATASYMKEELRQMWSLDSKEYTDQFIMSWIIRAEQSGIKMLKDFSKTIKRHFKKILAYYD